MGSCPMPLRAEEVWLLVMLGEKLRSSTESMGNLRRSHPITGKVCDDVTVNRGKRRASQSPAQG